MEGDWLLGTAVLVDEADEVEEEEGEELAEGLLLFVAGVIAGAWEALVVTARAGSEEACTDVACCDWVETAALVAAATTAAVWSTGRS
jgi:hypothetical protein